MVPIRVLLVEDDPADAECTARAMTKTAHADFDLCWVRQLAEAFERLRTGQFDVVLLDLGLPDGGGLQALEEIRCRHHALPIVVLTGLRDEAVALAALEQGAQDYLVKCRLTADSLSRSIRYAIQRQQLLAATAERELIVRDAEARKSAMLEAALDAIITIDHEGKIVEFNPAAERTFGYTRTEMIGKPMAESIIPAAYREKHQLGMARCLATGEGRILNQRLEMTALRKGGIEFPVELTLARIHIAGSPMFTAYMRDVSDRKQGEEALRERIHLASLTAEMGVILTRRESLRIMLQGCAEAVNQHLDAAFTRIWTLNANQNLLELQASAGMYTHLNGPHSRVPVGQLKIGRIAQERVPHLTNKVIGDPRVGDQEWANREGMVAFAGYPLVCEDRLVGVLALFARRELSAAAIKALEAVADGIAMGIEKCRVADELRCSQERFELAVRGSSDGLWDWNILTNDCYRSPRLREMVGDEGAELTDLATAWISRMHPEDRETTWALVQRSIAEHTQFCCEHRLRTKSGQYRWFFARGQALWDENGKAYRMAGSVTDITERKQMEAALAERDRQLRQAQKLEAVGSLAGGIAHEFNNLLQGILGYTKLAMEGLPPESQSWQDLEQVNKAASRASMLTRQLLSFSRHQVLERVAVDPQGVVADLVKMLRPLIGEQIDLEVPPAGEVGTLYADPGLLQQMLLNLCINARDAMPDGGRLVLNIQRVELNEEDSNRSLPVRPGPYVLFSVADTGCGMCAEVRERIFEPFFTTKDVGHGTGLGLAMVYGVVQQHEGKIDVYSELGIGTTFKIYLPTTAVAQADSSPQPSGPARGGGETILIAEDDPIVRDLAVRVLTRAGYSVLAAADGQKAIELFESHADVISLALLDAVMPRCTGREVHDRIKLQKPNLAVVFCSGYDPDAGQVRFLEDHRLRLVSKPYDSQTLLRTVREVLDDQPLLDMSPCLT